MAAMAPPMSIQTALSVGDPVKNLETSELKELVFSNSIPLSEEAKKCSRIKSLTVAPLLARAVQSIHEETSVSILFI